MASFQILEDQENQISNIGRLKNNQIRNNDKTHQRRTVLGDINSNSTRVCTRSSKQESKVAEKVFKSRNDFVIHEDVEEEPSVGNIITLDPKQEAPAIPKAKSKAQENEKDEKLDLSDAVISVPREPLKDLKVSELLDEEEAMSESYDSPRETSPMSLESVRISSPLLRHSKPSLQLLYDMEEYREEIFQYLLKAESRQRAKALYMRRQPDVTYSMRSILVDWLVEVAEEYKLQTETLFLAVTFIDRFLSVMSVVKGKLQLLGTAAMFVAAKYEEIYPPDVGEFVYITDDTYNKRQVLRMEQLILKVLGFDISVPTIYAFLQHIAVDCNLSLRLTSLAQYLCELTLLEGDPYLAYLPSVVASSALVVARHCLEYDDVWSPELQKATGYSLLQLAPCVAHLCVTHSKASSLPQQAICDKYKTNKWHKVSEVKPKALRLV
ncbi:G2/mitotic-specific cyclin-A-like isoform X2 [Homalodisca vitripennis]|uniref:G2/mitotic-specific cyclin-A-like isoform X2 n=1 Tax=Homalodisca vitripennis TaxID=197043 RepID=UPI001EEC1F4A|nr:G2/mitotic-specific cyclin-A-like isoform X2 [Homalodisca vitripennis]